MVKGRDLIVLKREVVTIMAYLTFYYGAMSSGKTIALLMGAYNLENIKKNVLVIKSSIDTKAQDNLQTRIGLERKVDLLVDPNESLTKYFNTWKRKRISRIFVDEAQFLTAKQVKELWYFTKKYNIPVDCYGLKTQFDLQFFQGSGPLMKLADSIKELPTLSLCTSCGSKATINARYFKGKIELPGAPSIIIDGAKSYEYKPRCGTCYLKEIEEATGKSLLEIEYQNLG